MKMKMRVLTATSKGKLLAIADSIAAEKSNYKADIIPPAYPCANERLVILGISGKGDLDDVVRRFCSQLDKKAAQNVAILIDGDEKLAQNTMEVLKAAGTNVIDNTKMVKFNGLPFIGGKITEAEMKEYLDWAHVIVDSIK